MSENACIEYLAAKKEYDKAKQAVKEMVAIITEVANAIRENPSNKDIVSVPMIQVDGGKRPPISTPSVLSASHILAANKWPDAKQITNNLDILNKTYSNTHKLWRTIPDSEKSNLMPPDKMLRFE